MLITDLLNVRLGSIIQTFTTATNGPSVDLHAINRPASVALLFISQLGATATGTLKVQESADNSAWTDVAGATFAFTNANADDKVLLATINAEARKRYLRFRVESPANNPSACAAFLCMGPDLLPQTQQNALMFAV